MTEVVMLRRRRRCCPVPVDIEDVVVGLLTCCNVMVVHGRHGAAGPGAGAEEGHGILLLAPVHTPPRELHIFRLDLHLRMYVALDLLPLAG